MGINPNLHSIIRVFKYSIIQIFINPLNLNLNLKLIFIRAIRVKLICDLQITIYDFGKGQTHENSHTPLASTLSYY